MSTALELLIRLSLSLLPVCLFVVVLIMLDSYKLVRLGSVLMSILYGCAAAFAGFWGNRYLMGDTGITFDDYALYIAPLTEEILKAAYLVFLIRGKRVGFMVDASIHGFAIGAGFAIVENMFYLHRLSDDPNLLLWIVRGFGTAIMHGCVTALVGIISKYLSLRHPTLGVRVFVPAVAGAVVLHSVYNHFFVSPLLTTVCVLVVFPMLVVLVFGASERATRRWLGMRMDTDAELLEMINSGRVTESRVGTYLQTLKTRFPGEVVADMLCMLRLHLELSIRAKAILLMHEVGFKVRPDPEVRERFEEMKYLEGSIGKTGLRAVAPILNMSDRELWQLHMLGRK